MYKARPLNWDLGDFYLNHNGKQVFRSSAPCVVCGKYVYGKLYLFKVPSLGIRIAKKKISGIATSWKSIRDFDDYHKDCYINKFGKK